ncbi:unnamed protein product, partial [Schistosoma curassoni]|uniref:E5 protein n=1 Tax=Schistosoma curassoni TaxID=6186 RepID=A0A183JNL6_9TREM
MLDCNGLWINIIEVLLFQVVWHLVLAVLYVRLMILLSID